MSNVKLIMIGIETGLDEDALIDPIEDALADLGVVRFVEVSEVEPE